MARKRLTPARPEFLQETTRASADSAPDTTSSPAPSRSSIPPIAQVAAEASAAHALQDLAQDMEALRSEGRVLLKIALSDISLDHLARDRTRVEPEAFGELVNSIKTHGQRMPIEVTLLPDAPKNGPKYGLISGWRRVSALEHLHKEEGGDGFATVLALLRQPKDSAEAYVAMVEENEIRVGLSYFERAGIALETVSRGVFETEKKALQSLFGSASRAKRSRIRAFIDLHRELGDVLRFPTSIPERFGLYLIYAMREADELATYLRTHLSDPAKASLGGEDEMTQIQELVQQFQQKPSRSADKADVPRAEQLQEKLPNGFTVTRKGKRVVVTGPEMPQAMFDQLCGFVREL